ncbi:hypothetical protein LIER_33111 [Lithospermum erythrorhizon]|uniref:Uncharacterized protein n=1 Tax=Lithospermum erythrorhizon TaxID=34254 RepID=A0AAV3RVU4_LITER
MKTQTSPFNSVPSSPYSSTTTSLASSSIDSSSSSIPSTSSTSSPKCAGLDLLVKAIYQVTFGSVIGVPYIQKRVIRRRSKRSKNLIFDHTMLIKKGKNVIFNGKNDANEILGKGVVDFGVINKKKGAKKILKSEIQDSWRSKSSIVDCHECVQQGCA